LRLAIETNPAVMLQIPWCHAMGFFYEMENGGRRDHTRVYIANTRRSAQFSLGAGQT
jgi:hypothetical protein